MDFRDIVPWTWGKKGIDPFTSLQRDMNRLFESFSHGFEIEPFGRHFKSFEPRIDVIEGEKEIKVTAELPGMDQKDVNVSLTDDQLTIKGEKKGEQEEKKEDYYRMERSYGSFSRTVPLPCEIESDKVDATFKKGILTITLPKTKKALKETKKIEVKSE